MVTGHELVEGRNGQLYVVRRATAGPGYVLLKVDLQYVDSFRYKHHAVRHVAPR